MQAQIALLPNRDEKGQKEFFDILNGEKANQSSLMDKKIETDFDAILKAKEHYEQFNKMA